jgi:hypothetical protein
MLKLVHILVIAPENLLPMPKTTSFGNLFDMKNDADMALLEMVIELALLMNATSTKELVPSRHVTTFNYPHFNGTPPGIQTSRNSKSKGACVSMACKIYWWRNLCGRMPLQNDLYTLSYIRMQNGAV